MKAEILYYKETKRYDVCVSYPDGSLVNFRRRLFKKVAQIIANKFNLAIQTFKANLLTEYTKFLVDNGYCDTDVYNKGTTAIDRFMHPELNK